MANISIDQLKDYFTVNFETGEIFKKSSERKVGHLCPVTKDGKLIYEAVYFTSNNRTTRLYSHRVIFAMGHGYWPKIVDHLDGNSLNNALSNLSGHDSQQGNMRNRVFKNPNPYGVGIALLRNRKTGEPQYWRVGVGSDVSIYKVSIKTLADVQAIALEKYKSKGFTQRHYQSLVDAMIANAANHNYNVNSSTGA